MQVKLRILIFLHSMLSSSREDTFSLPSALHHPMISYGFLISLGKLRRSFCDILLHYFYVNLLLYLFCAVNLHLPLDNGAIVLSNRFVALRAFIFKILKDFFSIALPVLFTKGLEIYPCLLIAKLKFIEAAMQTTKNLTRGSLIEIHL